MITSTDFINENNNIVPENKIVILSHHESSPGYGDWENVIIDLRSNPKREWFNPHFYYCLPIVIGNQYGFGIRSLYDIKINWNGGEDAKDLTFEVDLPGSKQQLVASEFGSGILTIQNNFLIRTEPGMNLMVFQPPNYFIPGLVSMSAVIESDNLRRDFTFNIKITEPNKDIFIKRGDILSAFIPIKRYFIDEFSLITADKIFSNDTIEKERNEGRTFNKQRLEDDIHKPHRSGRKYFHGLNADSSSYTDHQKGVSKNE